jgi:hypothetical protein
LIFESCNETPGYDQDRISFNPELDEHTKLRRMVREVSAHLVPFGHYTATERVRIGRAFSDKKLGTQLSDRIVDMIHNPSRRRRP